MMEERPAATAAEEDLTRLRGEIERIDRALIGLIAERVQIARRVGAAKRAAGEADQVPEDVAHILVIQPHLPREGTGAPNHGGLTGRVERGESR
ncbi:MAG TPA: chorismate mutase, partial [Longimicrobiaceae bacterium]|nr:chorismate mutase [Longimicrobiaceae bacterium]